MINDAHHASHFSPPSTPPRPVPPPLTCSGHAADVPLQRLGERLEVRQARILHHLEATDELDLAPAVGALLKLLGDLEQRAPGVYDRGVHIIDGTAVSGDQGSVQAVLLLTQLVTLQA